MVKLRLEDFVVAVVVVDVRVKDRLISHPTIFCYVCYSFDATHVS